ncbi:hypothetical protein MAPG_04844 [Magnaporthiopsis poae ATCC 64411]|uniref:Uncharacterized protein n=1 Tax=Magnaporthiopsis poae (strain ATCC 64411 / 73-15) TaxID=644358 RepID=A0A0C4DXT7_MAGP6|nr:hypothetical protein MAPG_04844 [Magnaporthiopsis poae ATCC 64411]
MSSHNSQQGLEKSLEQWDGRTNLGPLTSNTSPYAQAYAYSRLDGWPAPQSHALVTRTRSDPNRGQLGHPRSTRTAAGDAGPERSHNEPRKRANLAEIAAAAAGSSGSHAGTTPALGMWLDQDMSEEPYNTLEPDRHYSRTGSESDTTAMAIEQSDEHSIAAATIGDWDADEQGYTHDHVWRHRVVKARATRQ